MYMLSVTRLTMSECPLMARQGITVLCLSFPNVSLQPIPTRGVTWPSRQATLASFFPSGSIQPSCNWSGPKLASPPWSLQSPFAGSPGLTAKSFHITTELTNIALFLPEQQEPELLPGPLSGAPHLKSSPFLCQNIGPGLPPGSLTLNPETSS